MGIGVAISTHKRPDTLANALAGWAKFMPDILVVNHDVAGAGVAATKNKGITALMDAGVEHLILADDDMWPVSNKWPLYVKDPALHLMHCWGKSRFVADDGFHTRWSWPRGVMLYAHRSVIEAVGGMRLDFGRWGGEHVEWSRRIHAAGFTDYPFMDVSAARHGIWYCEDYTRRVRSTVSASERAKSANRRHDLYRKYAGSTDHVNYRENP